MQQGELFGQETTRTATPPDPPAHQFRQRLQAGFGLWVDPFTADYMLRALGQGSAQVQFIAADSRSGRSAFHVMPAQALRRS